MPLRGHAPARLTDGTTSALDTSLALVLLISSGPSVSMLSAWHHTMSHIHTHLCTSDEAPEHEACETLGHDIDGVPSLRRVPARSILRLRSCAQIPPEPDHVTQAIHHRAHEQGAGA